MPKLRIDEVNFRKAGPAHLLASVHLLIVGEDDVSLADWTLIHMTPDAVHQHTFKFPLSVDGDSEWNVAPGTRVTVAAVDGQREDDSPHNRRDETALTFFWNLRRPVEIGVGDMIAVREVQGVVEAHVEIGLGFRLLTD